MIDHREELDFWKTKCTNLEAVIAKLKIQPEDSSKYPEFERQIKNYQQEIERLSFILKDTTNENNQLRASYSSLQQELSLKMAYLKEHESNQKIYIENESIYKSDLSKLQAALQQLNSNDSKRSQSLVCELERATSSLRSRNEEYEQLRIKFQEAENAYSQQNHFKSEEINRINQLYQSVQVEYTFKLNQKSEEIERLRASISKFEKEGKRSSEFEAKYMHLCQEQERLEQTLRTKIEENEQLRCHIEQLARQANDTSKYQNYENKVILLTSEIERLYQSFRTRNEEFEQLRQQYLNETEALKSELSRSLRSKQDELERMKISSEQKVALLSTEIERYSVQIRNKNDELEKLRQQLSCSMKGCQKLYDLESNNQSLAQETERLNCILKMKLQETEQIRAQYLKVENVNREQEYKFAQFLQEYKQLEQKLKDCYIRIFLVSSENERLTLVLSQLQVNYSDQISRTYTEKISILTQVDLFFAFIPKELDSWKQQFVILNKEYHKAQEASLLAQAELQTLKRQKSSTIVYKVRIQKIYFQETIDDNFKIQTRLSSFSQKENINFNGESQRSGMQQQNNFKSVQQNGRNSSYDQ